MNNINMTVIFSLLILCVDIFRYSALDSVEIHECETNKNVSMIASGSDINICCVITEEECNKTTSLNQLEIFPEGNNTNAANRQIKQTKCSASWLITSASVADSKQYMCSINGTVVNTINITVLEKPTSPNFTSILVSDEKDFIIKFDTGHQSAPRDYVVSYKDLKGKRELCKSNCASENSCLCEFNNPDLEFLVSSQLDFLIINVSVPSSNFPIQSVQVEKNINCLDYIVPGCVQEFMVIDVQENKATFQFRPSTKTEPLIDLMNENGKLFYYNVELWSLDGSNVIYEMNFDKIILFGFDFNLDYSLQFAALEFLYLTSSTTYSLSVKAIATGGSGCVRNLNFTTKPKSPEVELFTFSRFISQSNFSTVWLMWKPEQKKGGKQVYYELELSCGSLPKYSLNTSQNYIFDQCLPQDPLSVNMWSRTDEEKSKNFSSLQIPPVTEILEYSIIIEWINDSHVLVLASLYDTENIQEVALHSCKGDRDVNSLLDFCTEYPATKIFDQKSLNEISGKFIFELPVETLEVKTFQKNVTCYEYVDKSQMYTSSIKTVLANVTLNQKKLYDWSYEDPFFKLRDLTPEDERISRSVASTEPSPVDLTKSWQPTTSRVGDFPRVFMSTKKKGLWQGMQQAKCYFSRKFTKATIIVLHQNGVIKISQECDTVTPKQYLVNYFEVYAAPSSNCFENERHYLATLNNTIFNATIYQLPQDWVVICVIAVGSNRSSKTIKFLENSISPESSNTTAIIVVVVLVALACISLAIACFVYRCIRSKKYFEKMTISSKTDSLPVVPQSQLTEVKDTLSSVTYANDSGQGSSCESTLGTSATLETTSNLNEKNSPLEPINTVIETNLLQSEKIQRQEMAGELIPSNGSLEPCCHLKSSEEFLIEVNDLPDYNAQKSEISPEVTSETYSDSYDMSDFGSTSDSNDKSDGDSMSDSSDNVISSQPINMVAPSSRDDHYSHLTEKVHHSD